MRFLAALIILFTLTACTPKGSGGRSKISLTIPTVNELNSKGSLQKVTSLGVNASSLMWEDACFMVAVNAPDIANTSVGSCDLPSGLFKGSVAPSSNSVTHTLVLDDVPKGDGRRFDVYAYFHAVGESCPSYPNLNMFNKARVARLGFTQGVSLQRDVETVSVDISLPTQMIAAEAGLPATCSVASTSTLRGVAGTQTRQVTTLNYKVSTAVGGSAKRFIETGSGYKVYRKRGTAP